jgi:hypothetical protein
MGIQSGSRYHKEKERLRKERADAKRERKQQQREAKRKGMASGDSVNAVESVEQHDDINQQR